MSYNCTSFGYYLSKCDPEQVATNIKIYKQLEDSHEEFVFIVKHLKEYYQNNTHTHGIITPSDVIFVYKDNKPDHPSPNMIFVESKTNKMNLFTIGVTLHDVIDRYMKDFSDPFHWILMNPITIRHNESVSNNSDEVKNSDETKKDEELQLSSEFINEMCGELLVEILIEYAKR